MHYAGGNRISPEGGRGSKSLSPHARYHPLMIVIVKGPWNGWMCLHLCVYYYYILSGDLSLSLSYLGRLLVPSPPSPPLLRAPFLYTIHNLTSLIHTVLLANTH